MKRDWRPPSAATVLVALHLLACPTTSNAFLPGGFSACSVVSQRHVARRVAGDWGWGQFGQFKRCQQQRHQGSMCGSHNDEDIAQCNKRARTWSNEDGEDLVQVANNLWCAERPFVWNGIDVGKERCISLFDRTTRSTLSNTCMYEYSFIVCCCLLLSRAA